MIKSDMTEKLFVTRRKFLTGSFVATAVLAAGLAAGTDPAFAKKRSQKAVRYQATPKGGKNCAGCKHFVASDKSCKQVDGSVSAKGWCIIWVKA